MNSYFLEIKKKFNTNFWVNNPTPVDAQKAIDAGAIACTTNPAFLSKLPSTPQKEELEAAIRAEAALQQPEGLAVDHLQLQFASKLADVFAPLYEKQPGRQGFVSIQGNPHMDEDAGNMLDEALRYQASRPNIIPKIPVITAGIQVIGELTRRNIPTIATEVMSISQAKLMCEVYEKAAIESGNRPAMFLTHITGIFDEFLLREAQALELKLSVTLLQKAGTYIAMKQLQMIKDNGYSAIVLGGGARKSYHFTNFVGEAVDITINWSTAADILADDSIKPNRYVFEYVQSEVDELLEKSDTFRKAYLDDGLCEENFKTFGPVNYFRNSFIDGWDEITALVRAQKDR